MNSNSQPSAIDELLLRVPEINAEALQKATEMANLLRKLGLLSTKPVEVYNPFNRTLLPTAPNSKAVNWTG
jgi:hypothetical protein